MQIKWVIVDSDGKPVDAMCAECLGSPKAKDQGVLGYETYQGAVAGARHLGELCGQDFKAVRAGEVS